MKKQFSFECLADIAGKFLGPAPILNIERYGKGSINDSFRVIVASQSYLLQRINGDYFPEPLKLLDNFKTIVACRGSALGLSAVGVKDSDELWHRDESGDYWRLYVFFAHSYSCSRIDTVYQAYEIAKAYGQYLAMLARLPLASLHTTVPEFHNTLRRYEQLLLAGDRNAFGRAADCRQELEFVNGRLEEISEFFESLNSGLIPQRLTHNDTGIDNVLLDKSTEAAVAVIDLDTTMAGYSVWDFGDLFRSALSVEFDGCLGPTMCFGALLSGYIAGSGRILRPEEIGNFASAGRIIALELGIRYLTDYLSGDIVFNHLDGASLFRARKSFLRYKIMNHHRQQFAEIADKALKIYIQ